MINVCFSFIFGAAPKLKIDRAISIKPDYTSSRRALYLLRRYPTIGEEIQTAKEYIPNM